MTPEQYIKQEILALTSDWSGEEFDYNLPAEEIEKLYDELVTKSEHWDGRNEIRSGQVETDLECDGGRVFEAKSVAMKTHDGKWVGWTYYYGGGKHADAEGKEWMSESYFLDCNEKEKLVIIREFTKQK